MPSLLQALIMHSDKIDAQHEVRCSAARCVLMTRRRARLLGYAGLIIFSLVSWAALLALVL